jgi:nitroreductase
MMNNNPVIDCILSRRSTRRFEPRQIDREQLDTLLEAAIWAPSGGNSQSWLFTAIQNASVLTRLNELAREAFSRYVPDDDYPGKHGAKKSAENESFHCFHHAPTLIIASNRPNYENAMADCALALENIFLAAEATGLGSCYINAFHWLRDDVPLREYLATLGVPPEHTICSAAAVGYVASPSVAPSRRGGVINVIA